MFCARRKNPPRGPARRTASDAAAAKGNRSQNMWRAWGLTGPYLRILLTGVPVANDAARRRFCEAREERLRDSYRGAQDVRTFFPRAGSRLQRSTDDVVLVVFESPAGDLHVARPNGGTCFGHDADLAHPYRLPARLSSAFWSRMRAPRAAGA